MRLENMQNLRLSFPLAAMLYILLGLCLMLIPDISRKLLCALVGAGAAAYGVLSISAHLPIRHDHALTPGLLTGIGVLAFGVFSLIRPAFLIDFLFTAIALIVLIAGANGTRYALKLRSFGFERWWAPLSFSLAAMLLALSIIFFPGIYGNLLMMLCGGLLTVSGACDLWRMHQMKKYMETDQKTKK